MDVGCCIGGRGSDKIYCVCQWSEVHVDRLLRWCLLALCARCGVTMDSVGKCVDMRNMPI